MRIDRDTFDEILTTLTRNKSRSLLTAFGVFWGIFMLVALLGGGNGQKDQMRSQFDGFATNSCIVWGQQTGEAYMGFREGRWWSLDTDDMDRLRENIPELDVVTATMVQWNESTATYGTNKHKCYVKAVSPEYDFIEKQEVVYGRFFNQVDIRDNRKVCVLGKRPYEALIEKGVDPCGSYVKIDDIYFQVIGVINTTSNISIEGETNEQILIPFSVFQLVYNYGKKLDVINFTLKPGNRVADVTPKVEKMIKEAHFISPTDKQALVICDAESMFSMIDNLFIGIDILLVIVGAGTLLAGIIGVSNIMMVTVRERTVEIGIRRAIGAQPSDIMQQILAESVLITLIAGVFGLCAGVGLLSVLEEATVTDGRHFAYQVSFSMAMGILFVIVALGLLAGLAPARRAMSIKPVDAMRDE